MREYLEKNYSPEAVRCRDDTVTLAIKALLEVVQSGSKSMELAVMERGKPLEVRALIRGWGWVEACTLHPQFLEAEQIDEYVRAIERAREGESEKKKAKKQPAAAAAAPPAS